LWSDADVAGVKNFPLKERIESPESGNRECEVCGGRDAVWERGRREGDGEAREREGVTVGGGVFEGVLVK
jgi:hypothetical protein